MQDYLSREERNENCRKQGHRTGEAWGEQLKTVSEKQRAKTHLLQTSNGKRVSAADTKVGAIGDAAEVGGVIAEREGDLADVLFVSGGVLAGEGGVVVVDFSVEVRHCGVWDGYCV